LGFSDEIGFVVVKPELESAENFCFHRHQNVWVFAEIFMRLEALEKVFFPSSSLHVDNSIKVAAPFRFLSRSPAGVLGQRLAFYATSLSFFYDGILQHLANLTVNISIIFRRPSSGMSLTTSSKMPRVALVFALALGLCGARLSKDLRVRIDDGRIVGRYLTSESGRTIRAFMGIPYAQPPLGNLRFRAPVKVSRWEGILMAHKEPPMCTQTDPATGKVEGQEDCLYLNVYAPEVCININS
jgi:Carboxylesterase family